MDGTSQVKPAKLTLMTPTASSGWPIRKKLWVVSALLLLAVSILSFSCFRGVYSFRSLARTISRRATELPIALSLAQHVNTLHAAFPTPDSEAEHGLLTADISHDSLIQRSIVTFELDRNLQMVEEDLQQYQEKLIENASAADHIGSINAELKTVEQLERILDQIKFMKGEDDWRLNETAQRDAVSRAVKQMNMYAQKLPSHLQERMYALQGDVRWHYRAWIVLAWVTSISAAALLLVMLHLFYRWVFCPLEILIDGSRRVAAGRFHHRTILASGDEMQELADAMNDMTDRFQQIRDDLDQQVQLRTREVIRGEQLASVGFLAAGVAHEINNPLASIALCAESLEERVRELLGSYVTMQENASPPDAMVDSDEDHAEETRQRNQENESDLQVVKDYLQMIQVEAFRCKEITEKLLDFSRLGDVEKARTDLGELVQTVIDMVRHVGKYKQKHIQYHCHPHVVAPVNAQEIKQVVLNLITNGLESLDPGGTVWVDLQREGENAKLVVTDDGCGMTPEVREHLFEPFFTRRRDGQGTGLGMSITFRIVAEHGGSIQVHSDGPSCGSQLIVTFPLEEQDEQVLKQASGAVTFASQSLPDTDPNLTAKEPDHRHKAA